MTLEMRPDGVLVISGDVEELDLQALREALDDVVVHHPEAWVDLSATGFLPSAAIGVVARATGRATERGCVLTVVAADDTRAARTLTMTRVPFEPSVNRPA